MTSTILQAWMPGLTHVLKEEAAAFDFIDRGVWTKDPDEAALAAGVHALLGGHGISKEVMASLRAGKYIGERGDSMWITPKGYRLAGGARARPPAPRRPCPFGDQCGRCGPLARKNQNRKGTTR